MLRPSLWLLLLVSLYAVAHLTWYLETPLGRSPVLDGQENLLLAGQIRGGDLPEEPFYRAMLYPALLALLPLHWAALGLAAHLANTLLAYRIALRLWGQIKGALLSGALVGFNPVLLHFAFDPLDITLGITLFLGSIASLQAGNLPGKSEASRLGTLAVAGLLLGLACLVRPHFMAVLGFLALVSLLAPAFRRARLRQSLAFLIAAASPLLAYGLAQKAHSGAFQILPWQGAYNLWASNKPGANGLYLTQSMEFHHLGPHQNPTRLESEALYQQETGSSGDIGQRNAYWRSKTFAAIQEEPVRWIKLMLFKTYALLNSFEQYNNKTYAFHKDRSPWLRYNPLSWGALLVAATIPLVVFWRQNRPEFLALLGIAAAFAAGVLIYMASARFRLPLVPLLSVIAGGLPLALNALAQASRAFHLRAIAAALTVAVVTFSSAGGVASRKTEIQDLLLLADASALLGEDLEALRWATEALERDPARESARRLRLISLYNLGASGAIATERSFWESLAVELLGIQLEDERLAFIRGLTLWNLGGSREASAVWSSAYHLHGLQASACLGALISVDPGSAPAADPADFLPELTTGHHPILAWALARQLPQAKRKSFFHSIGMDSEAFARIDRSMQRVLPSDDRL